jgi:broad specificity phosphatase PhoE
MPSPAPHSLLVPSITLVRHGRSTHRGGGWMDVAGLARWRAAYDEAGIVAHEEPPPALVELAREARLVVASDMRRARESVARLVRDEVPLEPLLREPDLPVRLWPRLTLPFAGWALVLGAQWVIETVRRLPPSGEVGIQAEAAADWLVARAEEHGSVLAVTHAGIRRHVTHVLQSRGWRGPERRPYAPWSAWTLVRG